MPRPLTDQPQLILALSLHLLLLAFFIALTHLANGGEKKRSEAVAGSLNSVFAGAGTPFNKPIVFTASLGDVLADPAPMDRIGNLVRTELGFAAVREIVPGSVMEVTLDVGRLFHDDDVAVDPAQRPFFARVAAALAAPARGVRYDLEIAIGTRIGPATDDVRTALAVRRVAALATVLTSAGAPARDVAAGVEAGSPGRLRLLFHVRPAQEPPPPFATGSGR